MAMKSELIAVPVFQNRISTLANDAEKYIIFETENGEIRQKVTITLPLENGLRIIRKLKEVGVDTIICGAASGSIVRVAHEQGMRILPKIRGAIDEVVEQYLNCPSDEFLSEYNERAKQKRWRQESRVGGRIKGR